MTDTAKTTAPAASNGTTAEADPFDSVDVTTLPKPAVKTRSAEDAALATKLIAAMADGKAAVERTIHGKGHTAEDRKLATIRAAQLKRLANGAPEMPNGKRAAARIITVPAGGFQVAVTIEDIPAPKDDAAKRGANVAS